MIRASHIIIVLAFAAVISLFLVLTFWNSVAVYVNTIDGKYLLFVFTTALLFVVLLQIYFTFFLASALRVTRSCILYCKIRLGASVSVPWTLYVTGRLSSNPELKLLASFSEAGYSSVFNLGISLFALYLFNERYIYLSRPVNRRWAEIG